jgi:hypothetical protein
MQRISWGIRLRPVPVLIAIAVVMLLVDIAGCTDNPSYRKGGFAEWIASVFD